MKQAVLIALSILWIPAIAGAQTPPGPSTETALAWCRPYLTAQSPKQPPRTFETGACTGVFLTIEHVTNRLGICPAEELAPSGPHLEHPLVTSSRPKIVIPDPTGGRPQNSVPNEVPTTLTREQMIRVFMAYAKKHPERNRDSFVSVAIDALRSVYPCKAGI